MIASVLDNVILLLASGYTTITLLLKPSESDHHEGLVHLGDCEPEKNQVERSRSTGGRSDALSMQDFCYFPGSSLFSHY